MLKHILPAWLPLLLLITFLGCQSLETKPNHSTAPQVTHITKSCDGKRQVLHFDSNSQLLICGIKIKSTKEAIIFSGLQILKKQSRKQFEVIITAEGFRQFSLDRKTPLTLHEILLVDLNNRYKILNIDTYDIYCDGFQCLNKIDKCNTKEQVHLFPNISYQIKLQHRGKSPEKLSHYLMLQQLVWQSLNGDLRAKSILLHYTDWFNFRSDIAMRYDYYKKVVEKKSQSMCIKKNNLFAHH